MQRFNVLVPRADGGVEVDPMKEWLRRNPQHIPPGMNPTSSTSHQLRNALRKRGWQVNESASEVRLLMPSATDGGAVVDAVLVTPGETEQVDEEAAAAFALEAQFRDFIAQNLGRIPINGRRLALFTDSSGRPGVEYPTAVGPIDILAVDDDGNFVVFELKLDRGPDRALGQLARYMGWVKLNLAENRTVSGVVVAKSIDERLRYAAAHLRTSLFLNMKWNSEYVRPVTRLFDRDRWLGQPQAIVEPIRAIVHTARGRKDVPLCG